MRGAVQGVGFRPFVYRRAVALDLAGWVGNSAEGLTVEAEGDPAGIAALVDAISRSPPINAGVTDIEVREIRSCGDTGFSIRVSDATGLATAEVLPDLATCDECLAELFDPRDRRHRYPFINCTQCGPRYSIIESVPYDRARTSMRRFPMCRACRAEYEDPGDRRFHAEPNACPVCGPRLALWDRVGMALARDDDALLAAAAALRDGRIVALKGIGGFHLLVDARNQEAVLRLRARKRREEKPFAVMFSSLAAVRGECRVSPAEADLLMGVERPIVLLRRTGNGLALAVAPGNPLLGALLPYTPLHHLLMRELGFPVVATSANVTEEPIVTDERAALARLGSIADLFLVHDRQIVRAAEDSVARIMGGRELLLRRGRGYAPNSIAVEGLPAGILALGGHLKSAVAVSRQGAVVLSPHIGDLETAEARTAHTRAVVDLAALHGATPRLAVCDLHPDYASTRAAEALGLPLLRVQHHLAHVAAGLAEHGLRPPALGVAWDGTGYGPDSTVWGGEFLRVAEDGWRRVAHLRPFRLPGGEAAAREPRRAALGLLHAAFGDAAFSMTDLPPLAAFTGAELTVLRTMLLRGVNAPLASSVGRLFDAVAALTGLRQRASYEGQAAMELEWSAGDNGTGRAYVFALRAGDNAIVVDWQPALEELLADLRAGKGASAVSAALHAGLAAAIVEVARRVGEPRVLLTGGCFQNARLTESAVAALTAAGFEALWHRRVPPNDGGIALGQVAWAAWMEKRGETPCA